MTKAKHFIIYLMALMLAVGVAGCGKEKDSPELPPANNNNSNTKPNPNPGTDNTPSTEVKVIELRAAIEASTPKSNVITVVDASDDNIAKVSEALKTADKEVSVVIKESEKLTEIPAKFLYTESGNTKVKKISIPPSVTVFGDSAFMNCKDLEIDFYLFSGDTLSKKSLSKVATSLYDHMMTFGSYCFAGNLLLQTLNFANSDDTELYIWEHCFDGCKNLSSVSGGKNIKQIREYAFANCTNLTSVNIASQNHLEIKKGTFDKCYKLKTINYNTLSVVDPNFIVKDGDDDNKNYVLEKISIDNSITSMTLPFNWLGVRYYVNMLYDDYEALVSRTGNERTFIINTNKTETDYRFWLQAKSNGVTISSSQLSGHSEKPAVLYYSLTGIKSDYRVFDSQITINDNQKVYFRRDNSSTVSLEPGSMGYFMFKTSGNFGVYGDITAILGTEHVGKYGLASLFEGCKGLSEVDQNLFSNVQWLDSYALCRMFAGSGIANGPKLSFPQKIGDHAFKQMFAESSIGEMPAMPSSLSEGCCELMFYGTENLFTAVLSSTYLDKDCYSQMFKNSALNVVTIAAASLPDGACNNMFEGCGGLRQIKVSFTEWTVGATDNWVSGVASSGNFDLPASLKRVYGASNIPNGWTLNGEAPLDPSKSDVLCFQSVYDNCQVSLEFNQGTIGSSLETKIYYSTDGKNYSRYESETAVDLNAGDIVFFRGNNSRLNGLRFSFTNDVKAYGNPISLADETGTTYRMIDGVSFRYLFDGCTQLLRAPKLPMNGDYSYMFRGCTRMTEAPAEVGGDVVAQGMFENCRALKTAPKISANLTTADQLKDMFKGCSSLNKVDAQFTSWSNNSSVVCTTDWLSGVASSGDFVCYSTLDRKFGASYVPSGWTVNGESAKPVVPSGNAVTFTETVNGVSFKMVAVEGGSFQMGGTEEQSGDTYSDEFPVHQVTLSGYSIGQTEVTQALWVAVMGSNPSNWQGDDLPVERVSWNGIQEFLQKLNQMTGRNYRLPTEAEWEYAARGGNKSQGYKYSGSNNIDDVAWYNDNSGRQTHSVGTKESNELGIYDMSGNVWEWCQDWYGGYSEGSQTNPTGPDYGYSRVFRGGGWNDRAGFCRVSARDYNYPGSRGNYLGFRLAL